MEGRVKRMGKRQLRNEILARRGLANHFFKSRHGAFDDFFGTSHLYVNVARGALEDGAPHGIVFHRGGWGTGHSAGERSLRFHKSDGGATGLLGFSVRIAIGELLKPSINVCLDAAPLSCSEVKEGHLSGWTASLSGHRELGFSHRRSRRDPFPALRARESEAADDKVHRTGRSDRTRKDHEDDQGPGKDHGIFIADPDSRANYGR